MDVSPLAVRNMQAQVPGERPRAVQQVQAPGATFMSAPRVSDRANRFLDPPARPYIPCPAGQTTAGHQRSFESAGSGKAIEDGGDDFELVVPLHRPPGRAQIAPYQRGRSREEGFCPRDAGSF